MENNEKLLDDSMKSIIEEINNRFVFDLLVPKKGNVNKKGGFGRTPLHHAALMESVELAELLIEAGADANIQNEIGETPLRVAAWKKSVALVALLIEAGANPNIQNKEGHTPLEIAESTANTDVAEHLKKQTNPLKK